MGSQMTFSDSEVLSFIDAFVRYKHDEKLHLRSFEQYLPGHEGYPEGGLELDLIRPDGTEFSIGIEPSRVEWVTDTDLQGHLIPVIGQNISMALNAARLEMLGHKN